jgi:hypothetical protein
MELQLKIIGVLLSILAFVHAAFPSYFNWKKELKQLSLINRQLMEVHTFFIGLMVLLMGVLCFSSSFELVHTGFGKRISLGLGLFWGLRLIVQFFGYSSKLWKGKKFETIVHILFSFFWAYLTYVFFTIYLN